MLFSEALAFQAVAQVIDYWSFFVLIQVNLALSLALLTFLSLASHSHLFSLLSGQMGQYLVKDHVPDLSIAPLRSLTVFKLVTLIKSLHHPQVLLVALHH